VQAQSTPAVVPSRALTANLPIIKALPSRRELELKVLSTNALEGTLKALLEEVKFDNDHYRWKTAVLTGRFQNTAGEQISGRELLEALTERRYRDRFPHSRKDLKAINQEPGCNVSDVYDAFMMREYDLIPLRDKVAGQLVECLIPASFKIDKLANNSPEVLQKVVSQVCEVLFHGDVFAMSPDTLSQFDVLLKPRKGSHREPCEVTATALLQALSVARFKRERGADFKSEKGVLRSQGYTVSDTLLAARAEILSARRADAATRAVSVESLEEALVSFDPRAPAEVLRAIFAAKCAGREAEVIYSDLVSLGVRDRQGREASAHVILARYAEALYRTEHPGEEATIDQILRSSDYRFEVALVRFKREVLQIAPKKKFPLSFASFDDHQVQEFIEQEKLGNIIKPLGLNPGVLIESLALLAPDSFTGRDISEFVRRYVGLEVEQESGSDELSKSADVSKNGYILALLAALDAHQRISDIAGRGDQHLGLFIRTLRPQFEADAGAVLQGLDNQACMYRDISQFTFGEQAREFLQRLHERAADHFRQVLSFEFKHTRTEPFPYQREGARFLAARDGALLADEVGLGKTYQAAAAALAIDAKRVLWVTTASSKQAVCDDLCEHFDLTTHEVAVISDSSVQARSRQINALNGQRFIITNYETLVALHARHKREFEALTARLDLLILDEAQLVDNLRAARSQTIRNIEAPKRWLLSATPYQNNFANLWSTLNMLQPDRFSNKQAFIDMYTSDTKGLLRLHDVLADVMLRRTKAETIARFEDPSGEGFHDQLVRKAPRIPTLRAVDPAVEGHVQLAPEQEEVMAWMIDDFVGWAEHYNSNYAQEGAEIDINTISALVKFHWLHVAMYQPELAGIACESPVLDAAQRIALQRITAGEKVILWAWNREIVEKLEQRMCAAGAGAQRFDGTLSSDEKGLSRTRFQEDRNSRALVANYKSGGMGQTFTAATSAIIAQLPLAVPTLLQVEGRHNRLIGLNNVRHAKQFSDVVYIVPCFSESFLAGIEDPEMRAVLSAGTLAEQTLARLKGARVIYNFIMECYADPSMLEQELNRSLCEAMGLKRKVSSAGLGESLQVGKRRLLRMSEQFLPVWQNPALTPASRDGISALIQGLRPFPKAAVDIAAVFKKYGRAPEADLELALSAVSYENKWLRELLVRRLAASLDRAYAESPGTGLAERCGGSVEGFVIRLAGLEMVPEMAKLRDDLSALGNSPSDRRLRERFAFGMLALAENAQALEFVRQHRGLFEGHPARAQSELIYTTGLVAQLDGGLFAGGESLHESFDALAAEVRGRLHFALDDFAGRDRGTAIKIAQNDPDWHGSMDDLAALLVGWKKLDREEILEEFRAALGSILDGEYLQWRYDDQERDIGRRIKYLSDKPAFWEAFRANCRASLSVSNIGRAAMSSSLLREFEAVKKAASGTIERVEGRRARTFISSLPRLSLEELHEEIDRLREEKKRAGTLLSGTASADEVRQISSEFGLDAEQLSNLFGRAEAEALVKDIGGALAWATAEQHMRAIVSGEQTGDAQGAIGAVQRKANLYRHAGESWLASQFDELARRFRSYNSCSHTKLEYTLHETDAAATLTRMGCLEDDLINCFNTNGNPVFTQFVTGALGSKNMKMIVARDSTGRAVAHAMMKVRQDADGTPVFYLERGLASGAYDFREEMLELMAAKAEAIHEKCGIRPRVMGQVFGKVRDTDVEVFGTGCYSRLEYVEAVFQLRDGAHVRHHAREFKGGASAREGADLEGAGLGATVLGIGTANKRFNEYLDELREVGATRVVDVRAHPFSRRFPHFSRDEFATRLKKEGIEYTWLGDTLGNPADERGDRTLEGFERYQNDPRYSEGLRQLQALVHEPGAVVVVTCAEGREIDCHRRYILHDVRARIARGEG
jgi:hypothetical protein